MEEQRARVFLKKKCISNKKAGLRAVSKIKPSKTQHGFLPSDRREFGPARSCTRWCTQQTASVFLALQGELGAELGPVAMGITSLGENRWILIR